MSKPKFESLSDYLAQIERELRFLPHQARESELREIEAHLRALIEAGQSQNDADGVTQALAQFGKPRRVGRDLRKAWERKQPEEWWRVILAPLSALIFQMSAIFLFGFVLTIDKKYSWDAQIQGVFSHSAAGFIYLSLMILYFLAFHLITGFVLDKVSPKRCKWVIISYFLSVLMLISSEPIERAISAYDNSSSDSLSIIWFVLGFHILSTLLYFSGAHFGVRFRRSRKRSARIANAK